MVTKEELELGFNAMVASLLGASQDKINQYLKKKGVTEETMQKAKEAMNSLLKDVFEEDENS